MKIIIHSYNTTYWDISHSYNICRFLLHTYGWTLGMTSPWGNSLISEWNINSKRERKELYFLWKLSPEYNSIIHEKYPGIPPSLLLFIPIISSTTQWWQGPPIFLENYCCSPKLTGLVTMLAVDHVQYHRAFNMDTEHNPESDWGIVKVLRVSDSRRKTSV